MKEPADKDVKKPRRCDVCDRPIKYGWVCRPCCWALDLDVDEGYDYGGLVTEFPVE
jgi:hypothetical protein